MLLSSWGRAQHPKSRVIEQHFAIWRSVTGRLCARYIGRVTVPNCERDVRERVLTQLRAHGWNTTSFQILENGFSYWFDPVSDACVAYVDTGEAWVAGGAPIADERDLSETAVRFVSAAHRHQRRACFFGVEDRLTSSPHLASMPIGEQPVWDPSEWQEVVRSDASLREQLRRARAKGVKVRAVEASEMDAPNSPTRAGVEAIVEQWLKTRKMAPMGFLVDVQPFHYASERRCFVAEREGVIVAFLAAVPVYTRGGWLFEDLLRVKHAPNGTNELLIDFAMHAVAREGSRFVTLGLAPLAGDVSPWLGILRTMSAPLYDFNGVRHFKRKLRPQRWTQIHLAWPRERSRYAALYDSLAAFTVRPSDGHKRASFMRFGMETLSRIPTRD